MPTKISSNSANEQGKPTELPQPQPKTSEILSELLKSPIFYKLIVFESLNTKLFIDFINKYYRDKEKQNIYFNGIYIKLITPLNLTDFKFDREDKDKISTNNLSNVYAEKYKLLNDTNYVYNNTDCIFHILELDYYVKKYAPFKTYIHQYSDTDTLYLNIDPIIFSELKNIVDVAESNKKLNSNPENYESLLDYTIQELKIDNNKDVLTFLKLRNDEDIHKKYNNRFKIFLNKKANKLGLYYKYDDVSYYEKIPDDKLIEFGELYQYSDDHSDADFANDLYDYKYLFGPFTQIFNPSLTNEKIASKMNTIKNSLEKGNDVFIIGYGASGAGKTSTLVYLNTSNTQENGIVVNICNQLSDTFAEIHLSSKELYGIPIEGDPTKFTTEIKRSPSDPSKVYEFELKDNEFVSKDIIPHNNNHPKTQDVKDTISRFEANTEIGKVIIHMIDNDRLIFGTTNNPKSSRSHALIFLKLKYANGKGPKISNSESRKDYVYLIIGDFAGVENQFECDKPEVIQKFSEINVETRNGNSNSTKKIYAYKTSDFPSKFGGGKTKKNKRIKAGSAGAGSAQAQSSENPTGANKSGSEESLQEPHPQPQNKIPTKKVIIDTTQLYIYDFKKQPPLDYSEEWTGDDKQELFEKILFIYKTDNNFTKFDGSVLQLLQNFESADKTKNEKDAKRKEFETKIEEVKNILDLLLPLIKQTGFTLNAGMQKKMIDDIKKIYTNINNLLRTKKENINEENEKMINEENIQEIIGTIKQADISKEKIIKFLNSKKNNIPSDLNDFFEKLLTRLDNSNKLFFSYIINSTELLNIFYTIIFALPVYIELNKPVQEETDQENLFKKIQLTKGDIADAKTIIAKIEELHKTSEENKKILENQCRIRRTEGNFINSSLTDLRTIIKGIISTKNQGIVIPNFIGDCFNKYFKDDYFKTDKISKESESEIMKEIMNEIFGSDTSQIVTFKNNLIISIFCVFNISRGANNPPPTHYIDINKLKYLFKINKKNKQITQELKTEINDTIRLLEDNGKNFTGQDIFKIISKFIKSSVPINDQAIQKYIPLIQKFNDSIDNFNAPSALGTLDFLDSLAKYNTIDNICRFDDKFLTLISPPESPKLNIILSNNMKELYNTNNENHENINSFQNKIEKIKKNSEIEAIRKQKIEIVKKKSIIKASTDTNTTESIPAIDKNPSAEAAQGAAVKPEVAQGAAVEPEVAPVEPEAAEAPQGATVEPEAAPKLASEVAPEAEAGTEVAPEAEAATEPEPDAESAQGAAEEPEAATEVAPEAKAATEPDAESAQGAAVKPEVAQGAAVEPEVAQGAAVEPEVAQGAAVEPEVAPVEPEAAESPQGAAEEPEEGEAEGEAEAATEVAPEAEAATEPEPDAESAQGAAEEPEEGEAEEPEAEAGTKEGEGDEPPSDASISELKTIAENYDYQGLKACLMLGDKYPDSNSEISIDEAIKYYEKATQIDNETYIHSYKKLHELYNNKITELKHETVEESKQLENEKIISNMNYKLGLIYEYGKGHVKDIDTAISYYEKAKDYKIAQSKVNKDTVNENTVNGAAYRKLGLINMKKIFENNENIQIQDYEESKTLFINAFFGNDNGVSFCIIKLCDELNNLIKKETAEYEKNNKFKQLVIDNEVKKGNLDIMVYKESLDKKKIDDIKKKIQSIELNKYGNIEIIKQGAENENEQSQFILGMMYEKGLNVEIDEPQSNYWYNKSFENQYITARIIMSNTYNKFREKFKLSN